MMRFSHRPGLHRAFSLVELMVVLSIIFVVVGLALPSMRQARNQALLTKSLANQRQLVTLLGTYAGDYRDQFPYLGTPGSPKGPGMVRGVNMRDFAPIFPSAYFSTQMVRWVNVFDDRDLPPRREFIGVGDHEGMPPQVLKSAILMTVTSAAAPEFFATDRDGPLEDNSVFRSVPWTDIQYPSQKGVLSDTTTRTREALYPNLPAPSPILRLSTTRADGSAFIFQSPDDDTRERMWVRVPNVAGPVIATRDGFRGRDFID
ncbi:MAG: type II secretion system protein [Planctomycetota bacterium]|nr:type II secretion system protein [Planctomycetota bacterium]